jgi:hypothetical protein
MTQPTPLYQLVEFRLGESLAEWIDERRRPDVRPPVSWRALAVELSHRTRVRVSYETLRDWFTDTESATDSPGTPGAGGRGKEALVPAGDGQRGIRLPSTRPHPDQQTDGPAS